VESVDGVGAVTISGDRAREIHIVVDVEKLNAHGLAIDQVREAIQKENVEIPGGHPRNRASGKSGCGRSAGSTPPTSSTTSSSPP
jgi:multidrug efflux pump subunit AcrB